MNYGFSKSVRMGYEETIEKVREELIKEGFGVLTSIDVKETMKNKINVDFKKYIILGACNPSLAHKALEADEELGLLLPCNIIVYEKENNTVVSVFNPLLMTEIMNKKELHSIAEQVKIKLERVLESV